MCDVGQEIINEELHVTHDNETELDIEQKNASETSNNEETEMESESVKIFALLTSGNL